VAIAEDASAPAVVQRASGTGTTVTSASFSPPAASLLVVLCSVGWGNSPTGTPTLTASDSKSGTYTAGPIARNLAGQGGVFYRYLAAAPGAMTVTVTSSDATAKAMLLAVRVLTGAAATQTGAASGTSATLMDASVTITQVGSTVYVASASFQNNTQAVLANTTAISYWGDGTSGDDMAVGRATSLTAATGAATYGWTSNGNAAAMEVVPAAAAATFPGQFFSYLRF
jgi:hypothetical protein